MILWIAFFVSSTISIFQWQVVVSLPPVKSPHGHFHPQAISAATSLTYPKRCISKSSKGILFLIKLSFDTFQRSGHTGDAPDVTVIRHCLPSVSLPIRGVLVRFYSVGVSLNLSCKMLYVIQRSGWHMERGICPRSFVISGETKYGYVTYVKNMEVSSGCHLQNIPASRVHTKHSPATTTLLVVFMISTSRDSIVRRK